MNYAFEVINWIISKKGYQSYLEVGTHHHVTFSKIMCERKVGVDPTGNPTFKMKSDRFFAQNTGKFDLIFIDGNHESGQVKKDILNGLNALSEDGTIILHDVNPREERLIQHQLCYDAWWAFATLRSERSDLDMCTLPFDYIGCIRIGSQVPYSGTLQKSWKFLDENRSDLMNEITWEQFIKKFE